MKFENYMKFVIDMITIQYRWKFIRRVILNLRKRKLLKQFSTLTYNDLMNFGNAISSIDNLGYLDRCNNDIVNFQAYSANNSTVLIYDISLNKEGPNKKIYQNSIRVKVSSMDEDKVECEYVTEKQHQSNSAKTEILTFRNIYHESLYPLNENYTVASAREAIMLGLEIFIDNLIVAIMEGNKNGK